MDAEQLLRSLPPAWRGRLVALKGGQTNQSFRLETGQGCYWLRLGCQTPARLGINRDHEFIIHQAASRAGLAPFIRYADTRTGLLILDWLSEPDWRQTPGSLTALMSRVARLHRLEVCGPERLNLHQRAQHYLAQLTHQPAWLTAILARFSQPALNPDFTPVLCHCDLTAGNLMGPRPWLLDWEYACLADAAFELAVIADDRALDDNGCAALLAAYHAAGGQVSLARLRARLPWVQLLTLLWAMVQYQHTQKVSYRVWLESARAKLTNSLG
ncbi:phosphotransferase family protein [Oceanimonas baumannii]|uniref:phosphotransferase n=1 Tax=Oceanimonas baumannii TaxID=129578 RepID=UPI001D184B1F|nr:choline/ethanolamine kinase family protein [Oceanimonas baumannii]MCC4263880.1 phosphotransferase family protein [Oceanimonas baumannii]